MDKWLRGMRARDGSSGADEIVGKPAAVFFTEEDRQAGIVQLEMTSALTEGHGNEALARSQGLLVVLGIRSNDGVDVGRRRRRRLRKNSQRSHRAERERRATARTDARTLPPNEKYADRRPGYYQ